jgi:uncharacterized protein (TIGR01777 family)
MEGLFAMGILITGGTGLIGNKLALSLAGDGHDVYILSRNPHQSGKMPKSVSYHEWDGKTATGWGHLVEKADAIVNLAGANIAGDNFLPSRWTDDRKKLILHSRLDAGRAIVEAVQNATHKPKVLIQGSAVGYYGTHDMSVNITEHSPSGNDFLADTCRRWESSTADVEALGVRRAVIRTGIVLDANGGTLPRLSLLTKLFVGGPIGGGQQPMPWIHIDDHVKAIRYLIDHDNLSGAFNLSAPNVVTNRQMANALGKALNRPSFFPTPAFALQLMFGELSILLTEGQKALPQQLLEQGFQFSYTDIDHALNAIYNA